MEIAGKRADYTVRFFVTEPLTLVDDLMYVCNQWGITNFPKFLEKAKQLDFEIEAIQYE